MPKSRTTGRAGARRVPGLASIEPDGATRTAADIYDELAKESSPNDSTEARPLKKRKTLVSLGDSVREESSSPSRASMPKGAENASEAFDIATALHDSSNSSSSSESSSDESEVDWEALLQDTAKQEEPEGTVQSACAPEKTKVTLNIENGIQNSKQPRGLSRRLPSSVLEKRRRILAHQMHLTCLMYAVWLLNQQCNDYDLQKTLTPLLSDKIVGLLNPSRSRSQLEQTRSLTMGVEQAGDLWRGNFRIVESGWHRAAWSSNPEEQAKNINPVQDREDLLEAARSRQGSRDVGAMLFTALLRAVGVEARLVCSLQVLPFAKAPPALQITTTKPTFTVIDDSESEAAQNRVADASASEELEGVTRAGTTPRPIRRLGHQRTSSSASKPDLGVAPVSASSRRKRRRDSPCPVFWTEVFNSATQNWVPVDALVTRTINKRAKLEPPMSDTLNDMAYVIAFEAGGILRDVTRRYAKQYNAKTIQNRVESTKYGTEWLARLMKLFRPRRRLVSHRNRDQIEDAQLANYEAQEPMPRNVGDFKSHPYFALERHLRRSEVIHPKREVGKLRVGINANTEVVECIYRRSDVKTLKNAERWYRAGRQIKPAEQPLKYTTQSRSRRRRPVLDDDADSEGESDAIVGLYAEEQTELYRPPSVVNGKIPRNNFGNLDVYVESMIPPGAAHVRASEAIWAARIVGVDYVEAVTGFQFKNRQGTAIIRGVIVAQEYAEAIEAVVQGLMEDRLLTLRKKQSAEALQMWKKFLLGLRIRARIMGNALEDGEASSGVPESTDQNVDSEELPDADNATGGGGFLFDVESKFTDHTAEPDSIETTALEADSVLNEILVHSFSNSTGRALPYFEATIYSPWPLQTGSDAKSGVLASLDSSIQMQAPDDHLIRGGGGFIVEDEESDAISDNISEQQSKILSGEQNGPASMTSETGDRVLSGRQNNDQMSRTNAENKSNDDNNTIDTTTAVGVVEVEMSDKLDGASDQKRSEADENLNVYDDLKNESADEDNMSLMSHDPADDDLEPDWLVEETGF